MNNNFSTFSIITVNARQHVIAPSRREYVPPKPPTNTEIPAPNYLKTGCALVGVLQKDETIEEFKKRWNRL